MTTPYDLEELFYDECTSLECFAAKEVLSPISTELRSVSAGDISIFRVYDIEFDDIESDTYKINRLNTSKWGHAGIITDIYLNESCFEWLSYNRDVTKIEGLGLAKQCLNNYKDRKYMFFSLNNNHNYDYDINNIEVYPNGVVNFFVD